MLCIEASAPEHRWEALTAGAHFSEGAVRGGVPLPGDQRRRAQPRRGTGRHRRLQGRRGQGVSQKAADDIKYFKRLSMKNVKW